MYFDTCVWIDYFQASGTGKITEGNLAYLRDNGVPLAASTLVVAEIIKPSPRSSLRDLHRDLMERVGVWVEISFDVAQKAATMDLEGSVKPPDRIHLASAQLAGCDLFVTSDDDLIKAAGEVQGMKLCQPRPFGGQMPIDLGL